MWPIEFRQRENRSAFRQPYVEIWKKKQIRQGSDNKRCFAGLILATKYDRPERQNEVTNLGKL